MTMTQTEMQDRIIARAGEDGEFRAQLLADPRATIEDLTGATLPDDIDVQVHEESATSFHLVLPPDGRMTEEEMTNVFGGTTFTGTWGQGHIG